MLGRERAGPNELNNSFAALVQAPNSVQDLDMVLANSIGAQESLDLVADLEDSAPASFNADVEKVNGYMRRREARSRRPRIRRATSALPRKPVGLRCR